jgi:hypothetical protein
VEYEAEVEGTAETANQFTNANIDLVTGRENITLLNETVSASSVQVNDTIGNNISFKNNNHEFLIFKINALVSI